MKKTSKLMRHKQTKNLLSKDNGNMFFIYNIY